MVTRPAWASSFRWKDRELRATSRSEEHTSELQSRLHLVCRLLLEKKERLLREMGVTSHVAEFSETPHRGTSIDARTTRNPAHTGSQQKRYLVDQCFAWRKTCACM